MARISTVVGVLVVLGALGFGLRALLLALRPPAEAPGAALTVTAPPVGRTRSAAGPRPVVRAAESEPSAVPEGHPFANTYVRGRVFERGSGEGVVGALILVRATFGEPHLGPQDGDGAARFRTEKGGNFALRGIPAGSFDLEVYAEGFLPGKSGFRRFSAIEDDEGFEIPLDPAGSLSGRVVDETGGGVAGARVYVQLERARYLDGESASTTSGDRGAFDLRPVSVEAVRVYAFHPEFGGASVEVPAVGDSRREVEVRLVRGKRVRGRVRGPRGPLAGVRVEPGVLHDNEGGVALSGPGRPLGTTSSHEGEYRLTLSPGAARLDFAAPGFRRASRMLVVRSDDPEPITLDVDLEPGGSLSGRVLGANGRPAGRAVVVVVAGGALSQGESDVEGRFSVDGLPAQGPYQVAIRHHLHPPFETTEAELGAGFEYHLPPPGRLRGRVIDAVSGAAVQEYDYVLSGPVRARNSAVSVSGAIELDQLPPGEYALAVRAEGYQPTQLDGLMVGAGVEQDGLMIRLRPGATLAGFVRGAHPEAEVLVQVLAIGRGGEVFVGGALAADDGSFLVAGLPAGRFRVLARGAGLQGELPEVFVEEGGVVSALEIPLTESR